MNVGDTFIAEKTGAYCHGKRVTVVETGIEVEGVGTFFAVACPGTSEQLLMNAAYVRPGSARSARAPAATVKQGTLF